MTASWYIDSWAPRDGIAFASLRAAIGLHEDARSAEWLRSVERTVSLRPPNWEVIDAQMATALHAERFEFQRGFFSAANAEIAFASLDEVVEVIRRAYVAAGGDIDPGPEPADNEPQSPEPEGDDQLVEVLAAFEEELEEARQDARDGSTFRLAPAERCTHLASSLLGRIGQSLDAAIEEVALEVGDVFGRRVSDRRNARFLPTFFRWIELMVRCGFLDLPTLHQKLPPGEVGEMLISPWLTPWHGPPRLLFPSPWRGQGERPSFVLHHVPMPARSFRRNRRERLVDRLLLALSARTAWASLTQIHELATLVLGAATILAQQDGAWAWRLEPRVRRSEMTTNALSWLLGELPGPLVTLSAEKALDAYAEKETNP
jgi:hypothetical protein